MCVCACVRLNSLQALQARRAQCEHQNLDPVVWTCHRVVKWVRDIDLKVGSRVHYHPNNTGTIKYCENMVSDVYTQSSLIHL